MIFDLNSPGLTPRPLRWQSGHTAKTLAKYPDFRVVLIVMKTGGRL